MIPRRGDELFETLYKHFSLNYNKNCKLGCKVGYSEQHLETHLGSAVYLLHTVSRYTATCLPCKCSSLGGDRRHYHCCECDFITQKQDVILNHFKSDHKEIHAEPVKSSVTLIVNNTPPLNISSPSTKRIRILLPNGPVEQPKKIQKECLSSSTRLSCPSCSKKFFPRSLRTHHISCTSTKSISENRFHSYCVVDINRQIYFVRSGLKGVDYRVHACLADYNCTGEHCQLVSGALIYGSQGDRLACVHIRSLEFAPSDGIVHKFDEVGKAAILEQNLLTSSTADTILQFNLAAEMDNSDLCVELSENPSNSRHFSIWSYSDRVYVFLKDSWVCRKCDGSSCVHIHIARWAAFLSPSSAPVLENDVEDDPTIIQYYN